ncbi:MAG: hypothetical protein IIX81_02340, partial [Tidjanibacter sp.]|nr:hypothetical protein [Tidjanibacter sp.]
KKAEGLVAIPSPLLFLSTVDRRPSTDRGLTSNVFKEFMEVREFKEFKELRVRSIKKVRQTAGAP